MERNNRTRTCGTDGLYRIFSSTITRRIPSCLSKHLNASLRFNGFPKDFENIFIRRFKFLCLYLTLNTNKLKRQAD